MSDLSEKQLLFLDPMLDLDCKRYRGYHSQAIFTILNKHNYSEKTETAIYHAFGGIGARLEQSLKDVVLDNIPPTKDVSLNSIRTYQRNYYTARLKCAGIITTGFSYTTEIDTLATFYALEDLGGLEELEKRNQSLMGAFKFDQEHKDDEAYRALTLTLKEVFLIDFEYQKDLLLNYENLVN